MKLVLLVMFRTTHCLIPYRNALRSTLGGAINSKLHHAPGCLSVIPDNTGVRSIACIAAKIRSTNKHAVRKCDRERNGSIGIVYCTYIYPLYTGCFWRRELWRICTVPEKIFFYCNPIFTLVVDISGNP